jgi:ATPase subunit of ABC transporter with duplicated ATPase domains
VFEVGEGTVRVYSGNYEDYLWQKERGAMPPSIAAAASAASNGKEPRSGARSAARLNPIKAEQMRQRAAEIERLSSVIEREIGLLEAQLAGSFHDHRESTRLVKEIESRRARLDTLLSEWEQCGITLEQ